MSDNRDHYNFDEVVKACADHAWTRRSEELKAKGINSEQQLEKEIRKTVDDPSTRAFRAESQPIRDGKVQEVPLSREVYSRPSFSVQFPDRDMTVILNPNRDEHGKVYGGTVMIRDASEWERQKDAELKYAKEPPRTVDGGRPALREQEERLRLVDHQAPLLQQERKPSEVLLNGPKMAEQQMSTRSSVDELAASYAKANPESGASAESRREAAYFAHAVEDSEKYPPRDAEMRERVEQRQFEEQFEKNYRKGSGEAPREENKQELMQERMQAYMDRQKQYTM